MTDLDFAGLARLLHERKDLSVRALFRQLAPLHVAAGGEGGALALAGHYRRAFAALKVQARSLQRRMDGAFCLYLSALYAERLSTPEHAEAYFATAYRELYGAVDGLHERYGSAWSQFAEFRRQVAFFDTVTRLTPPAHQQFACDFYNRLYRLPKEVLEGLKASSADTSAPRGRPCRSRCRSSEPRAP